jgi:hypothetical protein
MYEKTVSKKLSNSVKFSHSQINNVSLLGFFAHKNISLFSAMENE